MEIAYTIAALVLLPLIGAGLRWLRSGVNPTALLRPAGAGLMQADATTRLLGLLGWLGAGLAGGSLLIGGGIVTAALLLELGPLATAISLLLAGGTWVQVAGARRVQFAFFANLSYIVGLVALIALAGSDRLAAVAVWPSDSGRLAVHLLALLALLFAVPAKLLVHPFAVAADAEAMAALEPLATSHAIAGLAYEGGLLLFVAALLLPSWGGDGGQVAVAALGVVVLALAMRLLASRISVRMRPDQAYAFYARYGLAVAAATILGTLVTR